VSEGALRIVPLDPAWDRRTFTSGSAPLDRYFQQQVTQDIRRRVTACFVALEEPNHRIAGYYTLASASIALVELPADVAKRLPRYPSVPAVRMGRLAVDQAFQGRGVGGVLLADALARALRADIAAYALVVDAKDATAATFYQHHGFIAFAGHPLTLFLPLATAQALH
jgi:GNAT superfamily N-acetyltransferase